MSRTDRNKKPSNQKLNTYSYYRSSRAENSSPSGSKSKGALKQNIKSLRFKFSFFRLSIVITAVIALMFLLSASTNPIIRFSSPGVNARATSLYRTEAQKIIERSILNRTKLSFDYPGVEDDLKARFPEIETAKVSFDVFGRKPVIQLLLHPPAYLFQTKGVTWVVDDRGIAISENSSESSVSGLPLIQDEIGANVKVGDKLLSPLEVSFLTSVKTLLEGQQLVVSAIFIPTSPKEIDIQLQGEPWRYKLSTEEQASAQAGTLVAARLTLLKDNETPSEYVDIRLGEKVFWK